MAKDKISEYSATNSANTVVGDIDIDEGCLPSGINNAIREVMTHLKDLSDGTSGVDVLNLQDDDASASIKIQAPAAVTTTTTFTLPDGDGTSGQVLQTSGTGTLSWTSNGLANVVEDTTPQLGGNLDLNGNDITGTGNISTTGTATFSGDLTVDTNTLYVDSTNNRVGVGSSSPEASLHVEGSSTGQMMFRTSVSSVNKWLVGKNSAADFSIGEDGNEWLYIERDSGSVTVTSEGGGVTTSLQQGLAKAWLNHNNAHTILDSLNITSITDGGTGVTNAVTFTNPMNNNQYVISGFAGNTSNDDGFFYGTGIATTNFSARIRTHNGNLNDANISCLMAHGDLA